MSVFKNGENGTWYVMTRYTDWKGERKQKCKRGFATKREAQEWEQKFHQQNNADMNMTFAAFVEVYFAGTAVGAVIHLIVVPVVVMALEKARLSPLG